MTSWFGDLIPKHKGPGCGGLSPLGTGDLRGKSLPHINKIVEKKFPIFFLGIFFSLFFFFESSATYAQKIPTNLEQKYIFALILMKENFDTIF